ncbi:MAG: recombination protein O N-terminal domain-containing protein [Elusimicrobia bacterium]|nr:recombination protein O N-terminal domain-containing protein [Elusimicrobiota bacterium]
MRGRLVTTEALVLARRPHREADRVAAVFTAEFGKVPARFPGVDRPAAKLRSLAEPLVHLDLRMYVRHGAEYTTVAGASLRSAYPGLRGGLEALLRGLGMLELLDRLTPWWQPSPDKLDLTLEALDALQRCALRGSGGGWVYPAYALRLFEAAGYGMRARRVSEENRSLWEALHTAPWAAVGGLPEDGERVGRLEALVATTVEHAAERQLRWMRVREKVRERLRESAAAPGAGR